MANEIKTTKRTPFDSQPKSIVLADMFAKTNAKKEDKKSLDPTKLANEQNLFEKSNDLLVKAYENQKSLYDTNLANIFDIYNKNIAMLSQEEQQNIQDAYTTRELAKKYLGEYASNIGLGDVSGNLLDIYSSYAKNVAQAKQETIENRISLEDKYNQAAFENKKEQFSLDAKYQEQLMSDTANTALSNMNIGDFGGYETGKMYVESLKGKLDTITYNALLSQASLVDKNVRADGGVVEPYTQVETPSGKAMVSSIMGDYSDEFNDSTRVVRYGDDVYAEQTSVVSDDVANRLWEKYGGDIVANNPVVMNGLTYMYGNDGQFHLLERLDKTKLDTLATINQLNQGKITKGDIWKGIEINETTYKKFSTPIKPIPSDMSNLVENKGKNSLFYYKGAIYFIDGASLVHKLLQ